MSQVRTVFDRKAGGNAFFNRNLRASLRSRGLRFTKDKKRADAWLETSGQGLPDGGFAGQMTFVGRGGRVLSREKIVRAAGSRVMAYGSLARKMSPRR